MAGSLLLQGLLFGDGFTDMAITRHTLQHVRVRPVVSCTHRVVHLSPANFRAFLVPEKETQ